MYIFHCIGSYSCARRKYGGVLHTHCGNCSANTAAQPNFFISFGQTAKELPLFYSRAVTSTTAGRVKTTVRPPPSTTRSPSCPNPTPTGSSASGPPASRHVPVSLAYFPVFINVPFSMSVSVSLSVSLRNYIVSLSLPLTYSFLTRTLSLSLN